MNISPIASYNNACRFRGLFGTKNSAKKTLKEQQKAYQSGQLEGQVTHAGSLFNRHGTLYFRPDLNWAKFGKYLKDKFKDTPKVQTFIWGCSGGQEAYSLATLLKHHFGDDFKKFLPIEAMDINPKIIEDNKKYQQSGFSVNNLILENMRRGLDIPSLNFDNNKAEKFFQSASFSQYVFKNDILDSINFSQSNILSDLDKINSDTPSLVMCRNMWPYINYEKYDDYAKKLYDKLAPHSVVVIGGYDLSGEKCIKNSYTFPQTLVKNGFKPIYGIEGSDLINRALVFEK